MLYQSEFLEIISNLPKDHLICKDGKNKLFARDLYLKSIALANHLNNKGLKKGDKVLFACEGGEEFLILFMALITLRVKIALVDPHMGFALYQAKIKQFEPKWAFIDSRILLLQEYPILRFLYKRLVKNAFYIPYSKSYQIFSTGLKLPLFQKHKRLKLDYKFRELSATDEVNELVVVYTSGTIAEPKAVVHTNQSLFESLKTIASLIDAKKGDSLVTHLPHFALLGMFNGLTTYFWKENWSSQRKFEFIESKHITTLFGPPAEYLELMEYCKSNNRVFPKSLTHLVLGSAPVLRPFLIELRKFTSAKITCLYGMTEHLVVATVDGDEKINYDKDGDLLGKPLETMNYFFDQEGELNIQSKLSFTRYFHLKNGDNFHSTGDLLLQDESGNLVMKGRKKNMIIRRSKNIYPALYESTISSIPGVQEACLIGIYNDEKHDEDVYLIIERNGNIQESALRRYLKSGPYSIDSDVFPDYILFMKIPRKGRQQKRDLNRLKDIIKQKEYV